jgi:hypothetical protein
MSEETAAEAEFDETVFGLLQKAMALKLAVNSRSDNLMNVKRKYEPF